MNFSKTMTLRAMPLLSLLSLASIASAATITTTVSPASPVVVGLPFTVTLSMSGYTGTDEIDGYNFKIAYNTALFSYVPLSGAVNDGSGFGALENWLRKAPQDGLGAGSAFLDSTLTPPTTAAGTINVSLLDLRGSSTRGTLAADGFMYSFSLMANALGTGSITPSAAADGTTLYDVAVNPVGAPTFSGASVTVIGVPEPTQCLLALAGLGMFLAPRLRRR